MRESTPKRKVYIDERLFERIRQGEQDAFRELYEVSYRPLYAFLLSHTMNSEDAQDLLQDTYIQIYNNSHMYKEQGNPMAWMMKIAKNLFLMKCRKDKGSIMTIWKMNWDLKICLVQITEWFWKKCLNCSLWMIEI